jgi:hypothetical protein
MSTNRNIIHKKIQWHQSVDNDWHILDYQDIVGGIIQWKNILHEIANLSSGEKFGVGSSYCNYAYLTAIFAGIELGGNIIVMPGTESGKRLIGPITAWIHEDNYEKAISDGSVVGYSYSIPWSTFDSFRSQFDTYDHLDILDHDPDKILLTTTTSGSSGIPKVVEYSHRLFDDIRERSIKIFDFKDDDRILHLSNMHHGGTGGVFFLPSLSACKYHYYFDGLNFQKTKELVDFIKKTKITKAMFPSNFLVDKFLQNLSWLDHDMEIFVNQANHKNWVDLVKQKNIKAIHSLFGSTETLGPIFLNTIHRDSGPDHDVLNYGKLLDDFYSIQLQDNHVVVNLKNHYQEIINDCFDLDQHGNHIFRTRTDLIRTNDVVISMKTLNHLAQTIMGNNGVIVPDPVMNKIYVVYTGDLIDPGAALSKINAQLGAIDPTLKVHHNECLDLERFITGIKLSLENIRSYFRKKYILT